MAFTPDPETSWSAPVFAGAFPNPGIKIDLSSFIGKFDYNAAVFEYDSNIGVKRDVEINPTALFGMFGFTNPMLNRFLPLAGNYQLQISDFTSVTLGKNLGLTRSSIDYSSNREYKWGKMGIYALMLVITLNDLAVVYLIAYRYKDSDSGAKITVGASQVLHSISIVILHFLEAFGVEAISLLTVLASQLKQITSRLTNLVKKNGNIPDVLNPLLTPARITALKTIADNAYINADKAIQTQVGAVAALAQSAPAPGGCWVARAVYGPDNPRWILFRQWLFGNGPVPEVRTLLQKLYLRYGQSFARVVDKSPCLRSVLRVLMDLALYTHQKKAVGVGHVK